MKKKHVICLCLILQSYFVFSCTFYPDFFCTTASHSEEDIIVIGYITSVDSDGINFEILHLLRGDENNSNIRIWDGTDFECNGPWSMAASDFGQPNDTLVLILPKIVEIENSWDIIGDYRRPNNYSLTPILTVQNNIVSGLISGLSDAPDEYKILSFDYNSFIDSWMQNEDCSQIVDNKELLTNSEIVVYPVPSSDFIIISRIENEKPLIFSIYDLNGNQIISNQKSIYNQQISISSLMPGVYLILIDEESYPLKFVKM